MEASGTGQDMRQARADSCEERDQQMYDEMYASIEDRQRREYEHEFGPAYRAKHPFRPNGSIIHRLTIEALKKANDEH